MTERKTPDEELIEHTSRKMSVDELVQRAERAIADPKVLPIELYVDLVPTLDGRVTYALALHGQETEVATVHPAKVLKRIDAIIDAVEGIPKLRRYFVDKREAVSRVIEGVTFPELERRKEVESGSGDDNDGGPDAA